MEENEKLGRTNSNQPTNNTSENIGISEGRTVKRTMPRQRTVRRRTSAGQSSESRISDAQSARRRTAGTTGSTVRRRNLEGTRISAERRRPEGTESPVGRRLEGTESSAEERRPEGSKVWHIEEGRKEVKHLQGADSGVLRMAEGRQEENRAGEEEREISY